MTRKRNIGRGVAVVGAGMSPFGMFSERSSTDLFIEAFQEMIGSVDKGFEPNDIDAAPGVRASAVRARPSVYHDARDGGQG